MKIPDEVRKTIQRAPCCYLATCSRGAPNVVPVGFVWVEDESLLIADVYFAKTRANLLSNPRVAVVAALARPARGYQLKGHATIHTEGAVYEDVSARLRAMRHDEPPHAALCITVDEIHMVTPGARASAHA